MISAVGHVPYRRLDRSEIAGFFGTGIGAPRAALAGRGLTLVVAADTRAA